MSFQADINCQTKLIGNKIINTSWRLNFGANICGSNLEFYSSISKYWLKYLILAFFLSYLIKFLIKHEKCAVYICVIFKHENNLSFQNTYTYITIFIYSFFSSMFLIINIMTGALLWSVNYGRISTTRRPLLLINY